MDEEQSNKKWTRITRGNKISKKVAPYYVHVSNAYEKLEELLANLSPPQSKDKTNTTTETSNQIKHQSKFKLRSERRCQAKFIKYMEKIKD